VTGSQSIPSLHSVHSIQRPSPGSARYTCTVSQISSPSPPTAQAGMRGLVSTPSTTAAQQQPASS